jgi:hypothetical protein
MILSGNRSAPGNPSKKIFSLGVIVFLSRITRRGNLPTLNLTFLLHDIAVGAFSESPHFD